MASSSSSSIFHMFFLLSLLCFSASNLQCASSAFILPVRKDPETSLFFTSIGIGTPFHSMHLTIDLGGPSLWYTSDSNYNSSTFTPIPCASKQCPSSSPCMGCNGPYKPGCSNDTCGLDIFNPFADYIFSGDLSQDLISISNKQLSNFLSGVINSDDDILKGLPKQSKGMMGLARTDLSFPTQLAHLNNLPRKFGLCSPSSSNTNGKMYVGLSGPKPVSEFPFSASLIINPVSTAPAYTEGDASYEYFVNVKSISVIGDVVKFDASLLSFDGKGNGGTKFSTMTPYTKLHSNIMKPLVRAFVKKASDMKIKKVESVAPFEACFDKNTIGKSSTGLDVPVIDVELEDHMYWSIYGVNSMVEVKQNVVCLAFLDAGKVPKGGATGVASIVIGGYTLQDNYLEFDLSSSKLYFSNSLLLRNASCSQSSVSSF